MPIYEISGRKPQIGADSWIAPTAQVIGDARIGKGCHIGFGAIVRADFGTIIIGDESVIEDNVVIHCAARTEIGRRVIIGHMAMIHDCAIHDCALIGMKSMICDEVEVGEWAITAEQSLVLKRTKIPGGTIFAGSPAREIGRVQDRHRQYLEFGQKAYIGLTGEYLKNFRKLKAERSKLKGES